MLNETLAFIGGGNMARSLIGGLLAKGLPAQQVIVADPFDTQRTQVAQEFRVRVTADNNEAARSAQVIVLAVKPQELRRVAEHLRLSGPAHGSISRSASTPEVDRDGHLVISVAAGIRASDLQHWLGGVPVVRAMPNRPALNGCGMTGMYAPAAVPTAQRDLAARILSAVGKTIWVEHETQMDAVTAVSGSGPAYFFLLMELLEAAGTKLGLSPEVSRTLAVETAYGAGFMARELSDAPALLRQQVTSKGGTTEAALKVFAGAQLDEIVTRAARAAAERSAEMAEQFAKS